MWRHVALPTGVNDVRGITETDVHANADVVGLVVDSKFPVVATKTTGRERRTPGKDCDAPD